MWGEWGFWLFRLIKLAKHTRNTIYLPFTKPVFRLTFEQGNWGWWAVSSRILTASGASNLIYNRIPWWDCVRDSLVTSLLYGHYTPFSKAISIFECNCDGIPTSETPAPASQFHRGDFQKKSNFTRDFFNFNKKRIFLVTTCHKKVFSIKFLSKYSPPG